MEAQSVGKHRARESTTMGRGVERGRHESRYGRARIRQGGWLGRWVAVCGEKEGEYVGRNARAVACDS